ncbi:MAG: substrate-binding domain-containing protein [Acetatifactor sp.]|nr:substrate-binding domain-containing protein [Acetatifactor sp.]
MKRVVSFILTLVILMLSLTACGQKTAAGGTGGKVKLYISYTTDDFRQAFADAAVEEGSARGVEVITGPEDDTVEKQVAAVKQAVADGCTAILCVPVNAATAQELEVAAGDVPIIFCNNAPEADVLVPDKYVYVGSSEEQAGQFQAERLMELYPDKTEFNIVMMKGEKGHSGAVGRQNGFKHTMQDNGITVNYVFEDYADWSGDIAYSKFIQFLRTEQPYDAVVCHNDTMAVAIAKCMKSHHISTTEIPVLGVDATADGVAALESGDLNFTVYQSAVGQGKAAVLAGIELSKGHSISRIDGADKTNTYIYVPFEPVEQSNVKDYK